MEGLRHLNRLFVLFSLGTIASPKRNLKQCLCKIGGDKQRVLWYFPKWPIGKIVLTSPIVINVPTRAPLAVETKGLLFLWLANLNNKSNVCKQIFSYFFDIFHARFFILIFNTLLEGRTDQFAKLIA